jgi:hypothetical protein
MRFLMLIYVKFINTSPEQGIVLTDNPIFAVTNNEVQKWQKAKYRTKSR